MEIGSGDGIKPDVAASPLDASYLDSLSEEPWKSIARAAIPAASSTTAIGDANTRQEKFELDIRSLLMNEFFESSPENVVANAGALWRTALNLCIHIVHESSKSIVDPRYQGMSPRRIPILLIEDCLDALSIENSKSFWAEYVEPALYHPNQLLGEVMWKSSNACNLPFLRVCNQFLRCLETSSQSDQYEWRGRILVALAKGFPIADRSALKLWGTYHDANIEYDDQETFQSNATNSRGTSRMEYDVYESFWSLQAEFSNPNRIQVATFIKKLKAVLSALETAANDHPDDLSSSNKKPPTSAMRYLTSSSLFSTQLATSEFRSSVVSQFLIAASHLSSESAALANALAPLLTRAKKLLQKDRPEIHHFLCDCLLAHREDVWRRWKKEKCPTSAFAAKQKAEPSSSVKETMSEKTRLLMSGALGESGPSAEQEYQPVKSEDLLEVSKEVKKAIPTLSHHLESYVEALDPESGIEAEYHPGNDPLFAWRAMRLYSRNKLHLLKRCRRPADLERITREWYRAKGEDIPGGMPPESDEDDFEEVLKKPAGKLDVEEVEVEKDDKKEADSESEEEACSQNLEEEPEDTHEENDQKHDNAAEDPTGSNAEAPGHDDEESSRNSAPAEEENEMPESNVDGDGECEHDDEKMATAERDSNEGSNHQDEDSSSDEDEDDMQVGEKINENGETKDSKLDETKENDGAETDDGKDPRNGGVPQRGNPGNRNAGGRNQRVRPRVRRDRDRKRKRAGSEENDRSRKDARNTYRDGERRDRSGARGRRRDDAPPRGRLQDPMEHRGGGAVLQGPPPPSRRDDGPPPPVNRGAGGGNGGRFPDDRHRGNFRADGPPPPPAQRTGRHDERPLPPLPPRGSGGGRNPDRRDGRHGGGDRRRGRDDSRFRGRR